MTQANALLRRANNAVRAHRPREQDQWRFTVRRQRVTMDPRPSPENELTYVFFRSFGCRFDRAGECTMCNYAAAERVDAESMVSSVREALALREDYDALGVSPLGNMFDPAEVPVRAREAIIDMVAGVSGSIYSCESRPETLTDALIGSTVQRLRGKRLFVNLGLESAHPWVQAHCVGKSLSAEHYRRATASLRGHGAFPVSNVLLGAPFLTEEEAIESAVGTVRWALANGSHICVLFPSNVKGWTLQEWLWERDLYRTPSLWSLVEALRRMGPETSRSVVLSWYSTTPTDPRRLAQVSDPLREAPVTCPLCRDEVIAALDEFNAGGDYDIIVGLSKLDCACRLEWLDRMARQSASATSLGPRVMGLYDRIAAELIGDAWWQTHRGRVERQIAEGYDGGVSAVLNGGPR
jgi:radical SAM enzyme (TIGR01210 family)